MVLTAGSIAAENHIGVAIFLQASPGCTHERRAG